MAETVAFKYRASISYSHADTSWAKWLHRDLERFRIDKDFAGRETTTGTIPKSLRLSPHPPPRPPVQRSRGFSRLRCYQISRSLSSLIESEP